MVAGQSEETGKTAPLPRGNLHRASRKAANPLFDDAKGSAWPG
jgi:hypothetical protein